MIDITEILLKVALNNTSFVGNHSMNIHTMFGFRGED